MNILDNNFVFLDVETPNHLNDAISSIGLYIMKRDGEIIEEYYLVNPETYFDEFNIQLTKIDPKMVEDQPNFLQVWEKIKEYFIDAIVVAHNAIFDITVLRKCFYRYHLTDPLNRYMCTYRLARKYFSLPSYRLNKLCEYFNIELETHHNALCDTKACFDIFMYMLEQIDLSSNDIYHIKHNGITSKSRG